MDRNDQAGRLPRLACSGFRQFWRQASAHHSFLRHEFVFLLCFFLIPVVKSPAEVQIELESLTYNESNKPEAHLEPSQQDGRERFSACRSF